MCHCPSPTDRDIHRLVFPAVGPQHAGVYKSVIANKLGKAACYAHLYVTGEAKILLSSFVHYGLWNHPRARLEVARAGGGSTLAPPPLLREQLPLPLCLWLSLSPSFLTKAGAPVEMLVSEAPPHLPPVASRCGSRPSRWRSAGSGCDRKDGDAHVEPTQESGHGYWWVRATQGRW